jgi:peptidoglycan/LPS O-acetylase OafA/YrhL
MDTRSLLQQAQHNVDLWLLVTVAALILLGITSYYLVQSISRYLRMKKANQMHFYKSNDDMYHYPKK